MKLSKTQWIVVAVVAAIAVWYFFLRKKKPSESGYDMSNLDEALPLIGSESGYKIERPVLVNRPGVELGYGVPKIKRPVPTPTYPEPEGDLFGGSKIACPPGFTWDVSLGRCVNRLSSPTTTTLGQKTAISCPTGYVMKGGVCVPVSSELGSLESNWWGSDWARDMAKELNRMKNRKV